jgi:hypothetical protein
MNYDRSPPEMVADVLALLEATGFLNVKPDPNNASSVLVSPATKLLAMIEAHNVTKDDCGIRVR